MFAAQQHSKTGCPVRRAPSFRPSLDGIIWYGESDSTLNALPEFVGTRVLTHE